jgi:sigma-70-like protein
VSRKPAASKNPTELRATRKDLLAQLSMTLESLLKREADVLRLRFGLIDGQPRTLDEVAAVLGLSRASVQKIESSAMYQLGRWKADLLRPFLDAESRMVPQSLREELLRSTGAQLPLIWCKKHGWQAPDGFNKYCEGCPCPIWMSNSGGRKRYCSDACRQAASRQRRRSGRANEDRSLRSR